MAIDFIPIGLTIADDDDDTNLIIGSHNYFGESSFVCGVHLAV